MRYAFLNDQYIYESNANLSIFDSSITTGDMTTEVVRTFLHKPFEIEKHVKRLFNGLKELDIKIDKSEQEIIKISEELLMKNIETENENVEWQLIYIVSRGLEKLYNLFNPVEIKPTLVVLCFPLNHRLSTMVEKYKHGEQLMVPSQRAIPHNILSPQIKSRGRVHFKLAKLEIRSKNKAATPLLLNEENYITESTGSNIFLVKENKLYTPPSSRVLPGITRDFIINLANENNIPVCEEDISINDIKDFTEAFTTSTVIGIVHVQKIEDHVFLDGKCGPITDRIRTLFYNKVGVNFVQQALEYASVGITNVVK
ncbi:MULTISPECIES: aminotransferase class IV [Cytobacillus]|uniref:Branched-chain amino acid aminotransferase n=1 Tax=Cytobacillus oceanisediminis TaxID=665099 RepID=A0ABX3CJN9_9BACI|nr:MULTISPECIES: aminotransferase class IV [Cytobacillus]OHX40711.1 hypothetical protein BBV17_29100 [Cytobacillus oceanisediminis]